MQLFLEISIYHEKTQFRLIEKFGKFLIFGFIIKLRILKRSVVWTNAMPYKIVKGNQINKDMKYYTI